MKVKDLQQDDIELITNCQDIDEILESIGFNESIGFEDVNRNDIGCLFVKQCGGDYEKVWSCHAVLPHSESDVELIYSYGLPFLALTYFLDYGYEEN